MLWLLVMLCYVMVMLCYGYYLGLLVLMLWNIYVAAGVNV